MKSARGNVLAGSRVSPPVKVTLFQADCENQRPIIASPSRKTSAGCPPTGSDPVYAAVEFQPLAGASHHDEVHAAALLFTPSVSPIRMRPISAAVLANVKLFWIRVPSFSP